MHFKNSKFFNDFYQKNIELTKIDLRNSVTKDILLMQSINSVEETDKAVSILIKRLREWYQLHNPEFSRATDDNEKFVEGILNNEKNELLGKLKINPKDSVGADLAQEDLEPIKSLAHQVYDLIQLRKAQIEYISTLMDGLCPNLKAVCDVIVGAKLIEHAGSLKRLSEMPASTIQILGAEKALFRSLKTGSQPPKHGLLFQHTLVHAAPRWQRGKIARAISTKAAIAARVDIFGAGKNQMLFEKLNIRIKEIGEKYKEPPERESMRMQQRDTFQHGRGQRSFGRDSGRGQRSFGRDSGDRDRKQDWKKGKRRKFGKRRG
jgi:nucleolar protein 56